MSYSLRASTPLNFSEDLGSNILGSNVLLRLFFYPKPSNIGLESREMGQITQQEKVQNVVQDLFGA